MKYLEIYGDINITPVITLLYCCISTNESVTINDVLGDLSRKSFHERGTWNLDLVSRGPNITFRDIITHPSYIDNAGITREFSWNWKEISWNKNIKLNDVLEHLDKPWDSYRLSCNQNFTLDDLLILRRSFRKCGTFMGYNWPCISRNPNITMNDILNHPKLPWDWPGGVSSNPNIRINDVLSHLHGSQCNDNSCSGEYCGKWNWLNLSANSGITIDDILNHPELPWDWPSGVSSNPNLTAKFILDNLDRTWNWSSISRNKFDRYNAAVKIQQLWRKKVHFFRWKREIKKCNNIIKYDPDFKGIGFKEAEDDWENRI